MQPLIDAPEQGIIHYVNPDELNPFRDSPDSMALLDAIRPGEHLHEAVSALGQHCGFTFDELGLAMRVGGFRSSIRSQLSTLADAKTRQRRS